MESPLDTEAVLSSLKELAAERHQKIPQILEDYLLQVARTGNVIFENEWADVKRLLKLKLDCNIDYFQHFCSDLPTDKDFSLHQSRTFLYDRFDFFSRPPFTIQRLVEVLTTSKRQYRRIDKYLRAVEKNLMVVSTIGQEAEFNCEAKYVPHFNYSSPTVSKVGQADLIPLQNAAMGFDVRSNRVSMRIFNPALNSMNGDESDDEDEDEEMDEDGDLPFTHPALDGSPGEPMEGADSNGDSPGRKSLLRKRKLRLQPEQDSASSDSSASNGSDAATPQPLVVMEPSPAKESVNGNEAKETESPTASSDENQAAPAPQETTEPAIEKPEVAVAAAEESKEPEPAAAETEAISQPEPEEMCVDKSEEDKVESSSKPESVAEEPVEEKKDLEQSNDLEKPMEEEEEEPSEKKPESEEKTISSAEEEVVEKPSLDKTEDTEMKSSADSDIPSS